MAIGTREKLVAHQEMQCEEWKDYWIANVKAIGFPKENVVLIVHSMNLTIKRCQSLITHEDHGNMFCEIH
jgi:uncharacterized protein YjaZ